MRRKLATNRVSCSFASAYSDIRSHRTADLHRRSTPAETTELLFAMMTNTEISTKATEPLLILLVWHTRRDSSCERVIAGRTKSSPKKQRIRVSVAAPKLQFCCSDLRKPQGCRSAPLMYRPILLPNTFDL